MYVTRNLRIIGRLVLVVTVLAAGGAARGQEIWTGAIGDNLWTTDGNWMDGSAPFGSVGAQIIFGPDLLLSYTVNGADTPFTDIAGIAFTLADGGYTVSGTGSFSFDAGTGIVNDSLFEQTINVNLIATGTGMVLNAESQDIVLDSLNTGLTIDLSAGGATLLSVTGGQDTVIYSKITGVGGALGKTGGGTLTLFGTNDYDGQSSLFSGTVIAGNDMAFGMGEIVVSGSINLESDDNTRNIANDTSIDFALTVQGTFDLELSGNLSGAGMLTKVGSGTLRLSGTNSYTGLTFIDEGVLEVTGPDALSDAAGVNLSDKLGTELRLLGSETIGGLSGGGDVGGNVDLGANTLTVNQKGASTYSGVLFGAGSLEMSGEGQLDLANANTYTGGTLLSGAGVLGLGDDDALGAGDLTVTGESTLRTFGGFRTIANDMIISSGQLAFTSTNGAEFTGNVDLTGMSTIFQVGNTRDVEFSGVISNGALTKSGAGTLTLSGDNTYTGQTTVSNGTLVLDGSVAGNAAVRGGTLTGQGFIGGDLSVRSQGRVGPGRGIGTLRIGGDYEQRRKGTLEIKLNAADGRADLLRVAGSARLERGSVIELTIGAARFIASGDTFRIIRADGGVTDRGAEIDNQSATLKFILQRASDFSNGDRDYVLEAVREPTAFESAAITPNNRAIGNSLDSLVSVADADPDGPSGGLIAQLDTLNSVQYNEALVEMSPERYNVVTASEIESSTEFMSIQEDYLAARRAGTQTVARMAAIEASRMASSAEDEAILAAAFAAQDEAELRSIKQDQDIGFWTRGFALFSEEDRHGERSGYDADNYGGQIGGDLAIGRDTFAGLAAGYYITDADLDDSLGSFDVDTWRFGPYVTYSHEGIFLDASLSYGSSSYDVRRDIDTLGRRAKADYDGWDLATVGSIGYELPLNNAVRLTPRLSMLYTYFDYDGFTEKDAGGANLVVGARDTDSLRSRLSLNLDYETTRGAGFDVILGWQQEYLDSDDVTASFVGGGNPFDINTGDRADSVFFFGGGVTIPLKRKNGVVYVRYQGSSGGGASSNGIAGGVSFRF